jgi:predicted nucleic acid-binding protein
VSALYLETSAVLAWLLGEPGADWVRGVIDAATAVQTSRLTLVEAERGLVRAVHSGRVSEGDAARAGALLAGAARQWVVIAPGEGVCARAGQAFPIEPVRAMDALHLASALQAVRGEADLRMLSLDERVVRNAEALGMENCVRPPG